MPAYLDCAATTPVRPEVVEAMAPFARERFANPSGSHVMARDARRALDDARDVLADLLGARPGDIVFTSGGTEADNLAVLGVQRRHGGVVVGSAIEHHAVLDSVAHVGGVTVPVDERGIVRPDDLAAVLDHHRDGPVSLVSIMLANNETGVVQPLAELAEVVRRHAPGALLHSDAVQAFAWLDVAAVAAPADLVSISAHKFGGPKGTGVLVAREHVTLEPLVFGGGQERGRRSGTHDVAGVAGMAVAARTAADTRKDATDRLGRLRDRLADALVAAVPGCVETAVGPTDPDVDPDRSHLVAGICHLCLEGVESEALLVLLEDQGVCASAASSCSSGALESSHVLAAMGVPARLTAGSLRLSLGWCTTDDEVDLAIEAVPAAVERLRRFDPR